jgi:hypothetical protein
MSSFALPKKATSAIDTRDELIYAQMLPYPEAVVVAAVLAHKTNWAAAVDSLTIQPLLDDSCSASGPISIEERLEQEALAENDELNQHVQWLGHLLVFQRRAFDSIFEELPTDLHKSLLVLENVAPGSGAGRIASQEIFEDMYYDDCEEVFEWQERVSDQHLEAVLQALKKLASHQNPFLGYR